ncbi:MAG: hypothetical protein ACREQ5_27565, partial [Candidatus Dormibacteria bacterium]
MSELNEQSENDGSDGGIQQPTPEQLNHEKTEVEARLEGWRPQDEYHGDPERWIDAETFVKRGREINPILKASNDRLKRDMAEMRSQLARNELATKELQEYNSKIAVRAYERALATLKAERKEALVEGDMVKVSDLDDAIESTRESKPIPVPESSKPSTPAIDPVFIEWQQENTWYSDKNQDLMDYANAVGIRLHREQPSLAGADFLTKITSTVKKAFPDKFGSRRSYPNSVEGGGNDNFSTFSSSNRSPSL